jgi:phosphate acetyltransferase
MKPLETLLSNAARSDRKIVLSEGNDPRVVEAAIEATRKKIARIILVGARAEVEKQLASFGSVAGERIEIFDPDTSDIMPSFSEAYHALRAHKGMTLERAEEDVRNPAICAALLVRLGYADGTLGGAVLTTAEIVRAALTVIGLAKNAKLVSSFFLMLFCADHHVKKGAHVFADAGLVVDPNAEELAEIAIQSAGSFHALLEETARIAMLSFSTRGSSTHRAVSKVVKATDIIRNRAPNLIVDGELQFDAAFVPEVASRKAPDSPLKGEANVFVFPSLESGNIAYKIGQRLGHAVAIGPILQGLALPANDLSRGCSAEDVLYMIAVTAAQVSETRQLQSITRHS